MLELIVIILLILWLLGALEVSPPISGNPTHVLLVIILILILLRVTGHL